MDEPMSSGPGSESVLELLRVLGIHSRCIDLQPLLFCYVNLLADRWGWGFRRTLAPKPSTLNPLT